MKKYLCLLLFASMVLGVMGQPQWVAFTDTTPKAPRISLQSSSNQQVRYLVQISGMYQESITVGAETYQRLSIPKTSDWGIHGYPELPAISKLIAVPECDSITIGYLATDSIVLNNYNVYPKPLMVEDSNGLLVEQFYKIDSIYLLNQFMPDEDYAILTDGYLRNQRTVQAAAYPIKYNPATDQLIAYTEIIVSLTFNNSQGTVNVENGLFNNLTKNTLLNFNGDNHQLPPYPSQNPANVEWLEITSVNQAGDIDADYLIIADDQFFNPPNADLHAFACHRSKMNGFKVTIVSAQDIIATPFYYNTNDNFENEQKIRSFLQLVYEGGNAQHTYDGKVAFVLIAGDAIGNSAITGVPASKDPNPTGKWNTSNYTYDYVASNDYYYSCLTQNSSSDFDLIGDVFIGRFPADDGDELFNIDFHSIN